MVGRPPAWIVGGSIRPLPVIIASRIGNRYRITIPSYLRTTLKWIGEVPTNLLLTFDEPGRVIISSDKQKVLELESRLSPVNKSEEDISVDEVLGTRGKHAILHVPTNWQVELPDIAAAHLGLPITRPYGWLFAVYFDDHAELWSQAYKEQFIESVSW